MRSFNGAEDTGMQAGSKEILQVEHVHGYRGFDTLSNIVLVEREGAVWAGYPAGTMVVLQELSRVQQKVFRAHTQSVICLTVHSDGVMLASGDRLPAPRSSTGDDEERGRRSISRDASSPGGATVVVSCFSPGR